MESQDPKTPITVEPPSIPATYSAKHVMTISSIAVLLPLIAAFLVWRRWQIEDFTWMRLFWAALWTYPLMWVGSLLGSSIAQRMDPKFYAAIGDNPGQVVNLMSAIVVSHVYWIFLTLLFLVLRRPQL
jgi:hypothetical protein